LSRYLVNSSLGSEVVSPGGLDSGLINGDNSTVGVGNKAIAVSGSISHGAGSGIDSTHSDRSSGVGVVTLGVSTAGSEVVGTSSGNSGLIKGDHGTVGVGNKVGVQVQGSGISMGHNRGDGSSQGSSNNGGSHNGGSVDTSTTSGEVVSTGSSHGRLIKGDHGSVGMSHQLGVQVQGTSVAMDNGGSNRWGSDGRSCNGRGSNNGSSSSIGSLLSSEVFSTPSSNSRLI